MNSELEELKTYVESNEFAVSLATASNMQTYIKTLGSLNNIKKALKLILDPINQIKIVQRAISLGAYSVDYRYLNKWDFALSAYLYLISLSSSSLAALLASNLKDLPGVWWTKKIALDILQEKYLHGDCEEFIKLDQGNEVYLSDNEHVEHEADFYVNLSDLFKDDAAHLQKKGFVGLTQSTEPSINSPIKQEVDLTNLTSV